MSIGRILAWDEQSPTFNMSADQALLQSVEAGGATTLRFYGWSEPTLSLGYFQPHDDRRTHQASAPIAGVRRATGGGAIVHDHELTYSVAMAIGDQRSGAREELYRAIHQALVDALADFGVHAAPFRLTGRNSVKNDGKSNCDELPRPEPFLCFQRRTEEDLIVAGYKVLGSAQRRSRHAVLQHGSLLIRSSRWAPELPGISDLTSREISIPSLTEALASRFGVALGVKRWAEQPWGAGEMEAIGRIETERFGDPDWLHRR